LIEEGAPEDKSISLQRCSEFPHARWCLNTLEQSSVVVKRTGFEDRSRVNSFLAFHLFQQWRKVGSERLNN